MLKTKNLLLRVAMLHATALLLTACALKPPTPPVAGVTPSAIPPLAKTARQPVTPSECLPTCSAALIAERASWPNTPMPPAPPASSANGTTTR